MVEDGYARATAKLWLAHLSGSFTCGRRLGLTTLHPQFPAITLDNVRKGFFEPHQFAALRDQLPAPIDDIAIFAYLSGWRRGEILGLGWSEVDRTAKLITLPATRSKNGKARLSPLVGELSALMEQCWKARVVGARITPWVFHRHGEPVKRFEAVWHAACVAAGMPGRLFHDLRRTAVRDMVRGGCPRTRPFDRYDIVDARDQAAALAAMQAHRARALTDISRTARPAP
jgi:integrase